LHQQDNRRDGHADSPAQGVVFQEIKHGTSSDAPGDRRHSHHSNTESPVGCQCDLSYYIDYVIDMNRSVDKLGVWGDDKTGQEEQ
jgi:hypothetical protein